MRILIMFISFIASSTMISLFLGLLLGGLNKTVSILSLFAGAAIAFKSYIETPNAKLKTKVQDFNLWTWLSIIAFLIFSFKSFLWLVYVRADGLYVSSPNNLGDISLHIALIKYLASGVSFWPDNLIYPDSSLKYPMGMDLFNSLLYSGGFDLYRGLCLVGLLSAIFTMIALLAWGGPFVAAGFLFSGGFAGLKFLETSVFMDYQGELAWKSIPLAMFITQRGLLFAIPAGLIILNSLRTRFFEKKESLPLWIEVLLYSSMPLFHMHTFIYFSFLFAIWLIFLKDERRLYLFSLIKFAFIPASVIVYYLTGAFQASSVIHLKIGWLQGDEPFFKFWILNFGLFIPLVLWLVLEAIDKKEYKQVTVSTLFALPAVFLFLLFTNLMMASWEWDNSKLLLWSYLILLPFIWEGIIARMQIIYKVIVLFLFLFSGFVSVTGGIDPRKTFKVINISEVRKVESALKEIPAEKRIACYPSYNHPVLYSGRKVALGYPGWIWSHGYDLPIIEKKVQRLLIGTPDWKDIAKELNINYVFFGREERKHYPGSLEPWKNDSVKVISGDWGSLYEIN